MKTHVVLHGKALHRGTPVCVSLVRAPGPICFEQRGARIALCDLIAARTDRAVSVSDREGRLQLDLVEHLLAALGGLGIQRGVRIECNDDELPLLDGGAARFCEALHEIGAPMNEPPSLRIAKDAELVSGRSLYRFRKASQSALKSERCLKVRIDCPAPVFQDEAQWQGDAQDFQTRIAQARTFGWIDDYQKLMNAGRALGADLESVLVFDATKEKGVLEGCRPASPKEAAHHKVLDCIGDFALYGGPPQGFVEAQWPGHTATHAIIAQALSLGVLV